MKKKCLILFLVVAGLLGCVASAEDGSLYADDWVPALIVPESQDFPELRYPSEWDVELPELVLYEDGAAYLMMDASQRFGGKWTYDQEPERITVQLERGEEYVFYIRDNRLICQAEGPEIGEVAVTYARKENVELPGAWVPLLQTDEDGNYWSTDPGTETIEFLDENRYRLPDDETEADADGENHWSRHGNDVTLYVTAFSEDGTESEYPLSFYQLDHGLLKRYEYRDEGNIIAILYGNKAFQPELSEVESIRPMLNTFWELAAMDFNGVPVQLSYLGREPNEFLMFSAKGNGGLMRVENGENKLLKFSCRLEDGMLQFTFRDGSKVHCQLADQQYLTRVTGSGQTMYYRRVISADYPGLAEDMVSVMDLNIVKPEVVSISAGQKLQLQVDFADPSYFSPESGNNGIRWFMEGTEGKDIPNVMIDGNGLLSVDQAFKGNAEVMVTAISEAYGTSDSVALLIGEGN